MKLYLIRHGDYASSDMTQPLNQKGIDGVKRLAYYLRSRGVALDEIWHSPKARAVESAKIVAKILGCAQLKEKEYLMPDALPDNVLKDLELIENNIAIVSHLPFIPHLLERLFPGKIASSFSIPTASVVLLERIKGQWQFLEVVTKETLV